MSIFPMIDFRFNAFEKWNREKLMPIVGKTNMIIDTLNKQHSLLFALNFHHFQRQIKVLKVGNIETTTSLNMNSVAIASCSVFVHQRESEIE